MTQIDIHRELVALLESNNASFRIVRHEKEGRSHKISRIRGNKPSQAMKALVLSLKVGSKGKQNVLAVIPGNLQLNMKAVCKLIGAKKGSFASTQRTFELTNCVTGAIPPFSFHNELKLIVDRKCENNEEIVFNAGRLDRSIFMKFSDYKNISGAIFNNFAI